MNSKILNNIRLLPIYAIFIYTWLMAALGKLLGSGVPEFFTKMFESTFLAHFPGLTVAFYQIAAFELIAAILFIGSLLKLEFLDSRPKPLLHWGLWLSLTNFATDVDVKFNHKLDFTQLTQKPGRIPSFFGAFL